MYSRSYYPEASGRVSLPENYDGTAFIDSGQDNFNDTAEVSFIDSNIENLGDHHEEKKEESVFAGFGRMPIFSGLFAKGGILGNIGLKMPQIGTEEILIMATAAFLFLSKSGDKESALLLLLLLFVC